MNTFEHFDSNSRNSPPRENLRGEVMENAVELFKTVHPSVHDIGQPCQSCGVLVMDWGQWWSEECPDNPEGHVVQSWETLEFDEPSSSKADLIRMVADASE
jgi:hypothetical protein